MTMFLAPYTAIADIDGSPLDAGFLFFGEYGKDPELFPIEVFWDADFTVPAAQPIRTRNGYPVRNGSPAKVYLKTARHSIVIKNRNSAFILVDFKNNGLDASLVVDASGKTQHEINAAGGFWRRNPLSTAINSVFSMLDGNVVNIWEFADLADKQGGALPEEWDWSPAIQHALEYCSNFQSSPLANETCPKLFFPAGRYLMGSKVSIATRRPGYGGGYQTTYNIIGAGLGATVISSAISNDYMFEFSNHSRFIVSDLTFSGIDVENSKCFKLGDETIAQMSEGLMQWCDFSRVYWIGFVQHITIGRLYDSSFNDCAFRSLSASSTIPSYYVSVLDQPADSSNQLSFYRTGFESKADPSTNFYAGSAFFKSFATSNISAHYCFNLYSCHFEGGGNGVKLLDVTKALRWNFYGGYFVQTFERSDGQFQPFIELNNVYSMNFDGVFFAEQKSPSSWNTSNPKMIKIKGDTSGLSFNKCHFKSGSTNSSALRSWDTVFDYSEATHGRNSFTRNSCTLNQFTGVQSKDYLTLSPDNISSNRFYISAANDNSLLVQFSNNDADKSDRGATALRVTSNLNLDLYQDINLGKLRTTAATQRINFMTSADDTVKAALAVDGTGAATLSATSLILRSNTGAGDIIADCATLKPSGAGKRLGITGSEWASIYLTNWTMQQHIVPTTNAANNLGSSSYVINNIHLQNAPIVVSDERHKEEIQSIPDALLDAWGTLDFKMWKLIAAVADKGDDARYHTGLIAQQVKDALTNAGLDWTRYGLITYESWEAVEGQDAVYDSENNLISEAVEQKDAGEIYMLRMEECFAVEAAYQRRRLERIESAINGLTS